MDEHDVSSPLRVRYLAKENITAHDNNSISFLLPNGAIFLPDESVGSEEDMVTSLNLAVVVSEHLPPPPPPPPPGGEPRGAEGLPAPQMPP